MPIWAVTEVLSFGNLPYLFELMQTPDAREVARMFGFAHPSRFGPMLRMMVDFRTRARMGPDFSTGLSNDRSRSGNTTPTATF